jgi:hypothetical protein
MRYGRFDQKLDRLIVQHVEMISIHSRDAAMTVTHVFAQAHIGYDDQFRAPLLNRADRFLNDSFIGVG